MLLSYQALWPTENSVKAHRLKTFGLEQYVCCCDKRLALLRKTSETKYCAQYDENINQLNDLLLTTTIISIPCLHSVDHRLSCIADLLGFMK